MSNNIKIKLEKDEQCLINNVVLENCMGLTDILRDQKEEKGAREVMKVISATMVAQQVFFASCLNGNDEYPESVMTMIKPILQGALDNLNEMKGKLIKAGDPNGFQVASTAQLLNNVILKIPNKSLIITP